MNESTYRSGFVAVVGRPNTGKSTLVNALVREKVSIVTAKAQTTRHRILGVVTDAERQIVLIDTPGLHQARGRLINRTMNRAAIGSLAGADVILMLVDATGWKPGDDYVLERAGETGLPVILVVNKVDLVKPKNRLLPFLAQCSERFDFAEIIPLSALRQDNLDALLNTLTVYLPVGEEMYPDGMKTDRSLEFRIGESIREKLLRSLHAEVPYGLAVEIGVMESRDDLLLVEATIWLEKESHKGIVIGKGGDRLKHIGQAARLELEETLGRRVHLETRVKVKENWSDNARALRQLGYDVPQ